jgi:hypothetical protein
MEPQENLDPGYECTLVEIGISSTNVSYRAVDSLLGRLAEAAIARVINLTYWQVN